MAGQPGWDLQNEFLPGKFDVRDRARMEMEPQENLTACTGWGEQGNPGEERHFSGAPWQVKMVAGSF